MIYALVGIGVWFTQDAIASIWHYWGKERWSNHAFRVARLVGGVATVIMAVKLG